MSPAAADAASPWSAPGEPAAEVVVVGGGAVVVGAAGAAVVVGGGGCAFFEPQAARQRHKRRSVETRITTRAPWQTMRDCPLNGLS